MDVWVRAVQRPCGGAVPGLFEERPACVAREEAVRQRRRAGLEAEGPVPDGALQVFSLSGSDPFGDCRRSSEAASATRQASRHTGCRRHPNEKTQFLPGGVQHLRWGVNENVKKPCARQQWAEGAGGGISRPRAQATRGLSEKVLKT